jgi:hypothetical protein
MYFIRNLNKNKKELKIPFTRIHKDVILLIQVTNGANEYIYCGGR